MELTTSESPYELLLQAALLIPESHYLLGFLFVFLVFWYNFFEIHFIRDLFTGFRGQSVSLTFNSSSHVYEVVASKCKILHSRYLSTPWLCSPHLQTAFLTFFGRPPAFSYRRQLFKLPDGGTIALDWLMHTDVMKPAVQVNDAVVDNVPIMIVIPGLTSDSDSQYVKHLVFKMAKHGWNVVVSNHRGLGGISITSDCFYNAGWTDDIRKVVNHLHSQYPEAPLFTVGTSIGANILVKYLGEDGVNIPIIGAAAICSPWDLLICDRFISRRFVQRLYDKALTFGLKGYAQVHQTIFSRLADWEGIAKSRTVRDFDNYATCRVGKFETVDTYYRRCSSASYVGNVMVPLLCISALDDPVCTREAIPWDECRANKNVVLATTQHGGHLAYFEGITAKSIWWVRAVDEFLSVLHSSPLIHRKKEVQVSSMTNPLESSIDQAPYVNVMEDGMVSAIGNDPKTDVECLRNANVVQNEKPEDEAKTGAECLRTGDVVQNDKQEDEHPKTHVECLRNDNVVQNDKPQDEPKTDVECLKIDNVVQNDKPKDEDPKTDMECLRNDNVVPDGKADGEAVSDNKKDDHTMEAKANVTTELASTPASDSRDIMASVKECLNQLSRNNRKTMWLLAYIAIVSSWPVVRSAFLLLFKLKFRNFKSGTTITK